MDLWSELFKFATAPVRALAGGVWEVLWVSCLAFIAVAFGIFMMFAGVFAVVAAAIHTM